MKVRCVHARNAFACGACVRGAGRRAAVRPPLCAAGQSLVSMRLHCRKLCNHSLYDSQKGRRCRRKDADVAPDGARRSRDRGYSFGWAWLSAPASRLRAEDCVPPPLRAREAQPTEARSFRGTACGLSSCSSRNQEPVTFAVAEREHARTRGFSE